MMFPNWAKNIVFLLVYMISGLILVIIIEGLLSGGDLLPLNNAVELLVVHMRTPVLTTLMVWVTRVGNPFILSSVAIFVAVMLILRGHAYEAILLLTTLAVTTISITLLKNFFQISRPMSDIYQADGWSFPSGHATIAVATFFMLTYIFMGKVGSVLGKTLLVAGSLIGTILISFSRLYLGAHWALDIIGALALGLLSVSFTILIFNVFIEQNRSLRKRLNL